MALNTFWDQRCRGSPTILSQVALSLTKQVEYNTDSEESGDDDEQAHGASDDDNEESDSEASRLSKPGASLHVGGVGNPGGRIGGAETDDDNLEASGSDEERRKPRGTDWSSFHSHLDHKLSKEEVDKLEKKKWAYKWVVAMSNYKWRGTGECFLKVAVLSAFLCLPCSIVDCFIVLKPVSALGCLDILSLGQKELGSFLFHGLKTTLYKHWLGIYEKSVGVDFDSSKQRLFFSICNSYRDILHHNKKPFYLKGLEEDSRTMDAYIMHSLNHIFRTRDLVKKNDAKLPKLQENVKADVLNNEAFLDRGFTRSKVFTYVYSYSSDNEFVRHRHLLSVNADSSFALAYPSIGCDKGLPRTLVEIALSISAVSLVPFAKNTESSREAICRIRFVPCNIVLVVASIP
ncbi:putative xyloglucan endotransglucosylase/hydrolase protein 24-like [Capsicum annuum]|uniref:UTP25 NTP hydrolase-like domain-containing protein n=1 Tax=Capsicum annuum TaxID=4072 RepID=A0A2G2Z267_CAPAN|nr:putative xyloglucan endotransglucosylase/hydrolase protein 24-like [Capsicum annuum]PHT76044.1 hypothetical protein T459_19566 [Capsicum annuum]